MTRFLQNNTVPWKWFFRGPEGLVSTVPFCFQPSLKDIICRISTLSIYIVPNPSQPSPLSQTQKVPILPNQRFITVCLCVCVVFIVIVFWRFFFYILFMLLFLYILIILIIDIYLYSDIMPMFLNAVNENHIEFTWNKMCYINQTAIAKCFQQKSVLLFKLMVRFICSPVKHDLFHEHFCLHCCVYWCITPTCRSVE